MDTNPKISQNNRRKRFIRGTASGWLYLLVTIFIGFWLAPFLLQYMDREEYGLFVLVHELILWLNLIDIGISGALLNKGAILSGRPDDQKLNVLASTAFFAQLVEAVAMIAVGIYVFFHCTQIFQVSDDLDGKMQILIGLLVARSFFMLITKVFSSLLIAFQQIHIDNLIKIGMDLIRTLIVIVLVINGHGVVSLGIGSLVATLIVVIVAVWRTYRLLPQLRLRLSYVSWSSLKSLFGLGLWFSLKSFAHLGIVSTSNLLTAKVVSISMISSLSLTGRLYIIARRFIYQMNRALKPLLGQLIGQNGRSQSFAAFRSYLVMGSGITVLVSACIISVNQQFVTWWVGEENYAGFLADTLIGLNLLLTAWSTFFMTMLTSDLQMKEQTFVRVIEGVLGVLISFLLGTRFGLPGVIGGITIATILTSLWFFPFIVCRKFHYGINKFLLNEALRIVAYAGILLAMGVVFRGVSFNDFPILLAVFIKSIIICFVGVLLAWYLLMSSEIREIVTGSMRSIWKKRSISHEPNIS